MSSHQTVLFFFACSVPWGKMTAGQRLVPAFERFNLGRLPFKLAKLSSSFENGCGASSPSQSPIRLVLPFKSRTLLPCGFLSVSVSGRLRDRCIPAHWPRCSRVVLHWVGQTCADYTRVRLTSDAEVCSAFLLQHFAGLRPSSVPRGSMKVLQQTDSGSQFHRSCPSRTGNRRSAFHGGVNMTAKSPAAAHPLLKVTVPYVCSRGSARFVPWSPQHHREAFASYDDASAWALSPIQPKRAVILGHGATIPRFHDIIGWGEAPTEAPRRPPPPTTSAA
ncbi:hypothetical protein B0T26DRAFT_537152 [Lasiosphaeria miniovina]|uniref:Uncharacterized protein n=1 Tax=Lasiosphaeria miniovina TaxID=1954250 RepID=A0AA40DID4_9PEZI|nr:uncharacterized protein B0T26DRAFT_537152 [Lasiosphaeria miniovina]KAK0701947.1 hypothetical protein B0T26DRAFT_537152 [Lasiosphaeria miniovina]